MLPRRLLICCLLGLLCSLAIFADTLLVAGRAQPLPAPLVVAGNEVLAPLAPALEVLGAQATLTNTTISIRSCDGRVLTMTVDSTSAECAGQQLPLAMAPREVAGTLYLPAHALAAWLYADAHYDDAGKILSIYPLLQVTTELHGDDAAILVRSAAPLQYTSGRLSDPPRLFYDFKSVVLGAAAQQLPVNLGLVQRLRMAQFSATPAIVRLVADLSGEGNSTATIGEQGHLLTIDVHAGAPAALPATDLPPLPSTPPASSLSPAPALTPLTAVPPPPPAPCKLLDVSLASGKQSELAISADGPLAVDSEYHPESRQLVLHLSNGCNTLPPEHLKVAGDEVVAKIEADGSAQTTGTNLTITFNKDVGYLITHEPTGIKVTMGVFGLADMVITLDPGHGGHDTGAQSCHGTCEKTITLAVMGRVARMLNQVGAKVLQTRTDDTFIPLDDRAGLANTQHADVFVSVHCNSSPVHNSSSGTQVYYHSPQSLPLATVIHTELIEALGLKDGGIRQANFLVIRKSCMPAILIELAFINNDKEEALLLTDEFQQRAAEAIVKGLRQYAASNAWKYRRLEMPVS